MDDFLLGIGFLFIVLVLVMVYVIGRRNAGSGGQQGGGASGTRRPNVTQRQQIVEDIKATQTSRIVDAVQILDELGQTSSNYRQYCELVGHSQTSGGVTAPYSKRQVAYYDLRCYRVDSNGETLVAHEKSIDPFYFTDASSDTKVYVDLDSFDTHCILINATDRMESPDSDFSKALAGAMKNQASGRSNWSTAGYAGFGGPGHGGPGHGGPGRGGQPRYGGQMPGGLDSFLGGALNTGRGGFGGPAYRGSSSTNGTEVLLGMGLGMLLNSLASAGSPQYEPADPNANFRGYHVVEDVVPLNCPIYCLGEIYRAGGNVHMGKSLSTSYPSYYFAAKNEADVIAHLG